MKKLIIPLFLLGSCLLSVGILYGKSYLWIKSHEYLRESTKERELSLTDVKKTNIVPQADIDYKLVYKIRIWIHSEDGRILTKSDTTGVYIIAYPSPDCANAPVAHLPHPLDLGTLN